MIDAATAILKSNLWAAVKADSKVAGRGSTGVNVRMGVLVRGAAATCSLLLTCLTPAQEDEAGRGELQDGAVQGRAIRALTSATRLSGMKKTEFQLPENS